jgi:hypothetical protein
MTVCASARDRRSRWPTPRRRTPSEGPSMHAFQICRYDPDANEGRACRRWSWISETANAMLLDVLMRLKAVDPNLSFGRSCRKETSMARTARCRRPWCSSRYQGCRLSTNAGSATTTRGRSEKGWSRRTLRTQGPVRVQPVCPLLVGLPELLVGTPTSAAARPGCCMPTAFSAATTRSANGSTTSKTSTGCSAAARS